MFLFVWWHTKVINTTYFPIFISFLSSSHFFYKFLSLFWLRKNAERWYNFISGTLNLSCSRHIYKIAKCLILELIETEREFSFRIVLTRELNAHKLHYENWITHLRFLHTTIAAVPRHSTAEGIRPSKWLFQCWLIDLFIIKTDIVLIFLAVLWRSLNRKK